LYLDSTSFISYKYTYRATERGHLKTGGEERSTVFHFSLDFLFSKILVISFLAYFGGGEEHCISK